VTSAGAAREDELTGEGGLPSRSDALLSRQRILEAAAMMLGDRHVTMTELAAAARVGRSTLYRHFPTRQALEQALEEFGAQGLSSPAAAPISGRVTTLPFTAPGQLGRESPLALEVTRVLDEVPPHLVADQLVAEARRIAGVAVALYVVDIDGSHVLRLAGSEEFPEQLDAPPALGPEIVPEGLPEFHQRLQNELPGCMCEPLWLRGRVTGLLLCVGNPMAPLTDIAKQGAAALELANDYTDLVEAARRRKRTTPAAEVQQHLFPPRIARIAGAQLAGVLLPTYQVGGDWFDFVENRDGAWLAIADAAGSGPTAAGLGAAALGALRAARRSGQDLVDAVKLMHETVRRLENEDFLVPAWLARWRAATSTLTWVSCGHPWAYVIGTEGELRQLDGPEHPALGAGGADPSYRVTRRQLLPRERLLLVTDGIIERRIEGGGKFGVDGIRQALQGTGSETAASTAMAIQQAVTECWREPLEDDGTIVVMCVEH
jgi:serine phosphatase RsbU (regulator of sigma subunit)